MSEEAQELRLRIIKPHAKILTPNSWCYGMAEMVERMGRISHKSEKRIGDKPAEDFIRRIAFGRGHESISEHCVVSVLFVGSRSMSHQLVRHRIAAFTQESQRYCDYSKSKFDNVLNVIIPPSIGEYTSGMEYTADQIRLAPQKQRIYLQSLLECYENYLALRKLGIPAEDAREVLPNATKTEVGTTFNLRQWRHVFRMRCSKHAQWQIRSIMQMALREFLDNPQNPHLAVFFEDQRPLLDI